MDMNEPIEIRTTREKLRLLEEQYAASNNDPDAGTYAWELSRQSLARWIKKLKEELVRAELGLPRR
jgi:hypothetical protein